MSTFMILADARRMRLEVVLKVPIGEKFACPVCREEKVKADKKHVTCGYECRGIMEKSGLSVRFKKN